MSHSTRAATSRRAYATVSQAATYLGIGQRTVRRMVSEGKITAYRVGPRLVRVDLDEIDRTLRQIPTVNMSARGRDVP